MPLRSIADVALREDWGMSRIAVNRHASVNFNVINTSWDGRYSVSMPAAPGWNLRYSTNCEAEKRKIRRALGVARRRRGGWFS